jgi:hypothetical protein
MTDSEASKVARRNHGWLFILDEDFRIMARPDSLQTAVPDNAEQLVAQAAAAWSRSATHTELLMMPSPLLSARVFPLEGPERSCIVVYLEPIMVRERTT